MENNCNFKPFDKVLVRYDNQHEWQIDFFSHYVRGVECPYKTLKEAKLANVKAVVYRCWLLDGDIKGMTALKAYGTQVCTIKNADKRILDAIGSGTVGVGFKDKRMC